MTAYKHVLLAEDSPNDVELILAALSENKIANEVVVVRDGAEALDYLYCCGNFKGRTDGNPVVVLLDIKMPKVDGLEVLRQIKADDQLKATPVVILTSSRDEKDLINGYKLGTNAYVVKPVEFSQFVEAVRQLGVFWALINQPPLEGLRKSR